MGEAANRGAKNTLSSFFAILDNPQAKNTIIYRDAMGGERRIAVLQRNDDVVVVNDDTTVEPLSMTVVEFGHRYRPQYAQLVSAE